MTTTYELNPPRRAGDAPEARWTRFLSGRWFLGGRWRPLPLGEGRGEGSRAGGAVPALALLTLLLTACDDGRTPLVLYSPHGRALLLLVEETY